VSGAVINLLERQVYAMAQVDRLLALPPGTARRWIDGYRRGGKMYPPVVCVEPTGEELVTWGEFVETRLLSEYRGAGVPLVRMRPAIDRLRETFHARYPLAHSRPFVAGRELVLELQDEVGLARELIARRDVVHTGHDLMPETPLGVLDPDWIPAVARRGLAVIARDKRIRTKPAEVALLRSHDLRVFWLAGKSPKLRSTHEPSCTGHPRRSPA
jgi:hypothetical protein